MLAALDSGKTEAAWRNIDLAAWKAKAGTLGVNRAVEASSNPQVQRNVLAFQEAWLPVAENIKRTVRAMPKGTEQEAKARMNAAFDMAKAFEYRR